jgi:hypothetical protein
MSHYTQDQLASFPWIVSCDTLRAEDLLPKFWSTAETLAAWRSEPMPTDLLAPLTQLVGEDASESDWSDDLADQTLADLFDLLQDWSPTGFGFGGSEGDGACFGFWLTETWFDAMEHLGFGNEDPTGWAELVARLEADGLDPDNIEDAYQGRAEGWSEERAGADYAQQLAEELSPSFELDRTGSIPWPHRHVDWDAAWRELQTGDGYRLHDIGGGDWLVFRSV